MALAAIELADRQPQEQYWFMFLAVARDRKLALVLAKIAFFTIWTKHPNLWFLFYNSVKIDSRKFSCKYLSIVNLAKAPTGLYTNKINCKCSKCTAYSSIYFYWYWEIYLN